MEQTAKEKSFEKNNEISSNINARMLDILNARSYVIMSSILGLNYFKVHTIEEVARAFSLSEQRIRQIIKESLTLLFKKYPRIKYKKNGINFNPLREAK